MTGNRSDLTVDQGTTSLLAEARFQGLAEVPAEIEWFQNITSKATRRAYQTALQDFMTFVGIQRPEQFREVTRAHVIAWRDDLASRRRDDGEEPELSSTTVRHRLSALASLFEYLCERNTVTHNPVKGVKRPPVENGSEGKTAPIGDHQARQLLVAPDDSSLKGKRDRAILATLLYHALRREELCKLKVKDFKQERRGVQHLKVSGKGGKTRYVPLHPAAGGLIHDYLAAAGHGAEADGALFRSLHRRRTAGSQKGMVPNTVYVVVQTYSAALGFKIGAHALRSTAATNALDHQADIAKVQEWLGHANIATTRIYDHRKTRAEDSPTFKVSY